jgi:hypothetical protein
LEGMDKAQAGTWVGLMAVQCIWLMQAGCRSICSFVPLVL